MTTPATPNLGAIKTAIRLRHLQQLHKLTLISDPLETFPVFATYDDLVDWSKDSDNVKVIKTAIKNRVYGGPVGSKLDFANAFMAFMESAAMYLRDSTKVVEAVETYRSGSNDEDALRLLKSSTADIDRLADLWGMEFIQICDLVSRHPDGHSWLVGPFCGAFIPKDISGNSPFIGIAFKGTTIMSQEIINDIAAMVTVKASGRLWESQVASGFYYPMFSTYDGMTMPFGLIQKAVESISTKTRTSAVTHITGHSLGGAYSSLSYAQICIEGFGTPNVSLGDLYTFGCPRVGRGDFAMPLRTAARPPADNGSSWRIINKNDYVPKVPASWPPPFTLDPFIHVDCGIKIYPNKSPTAVPSEIGTHPTFRLPTAVAPHFTTEYYKSLKRALTGRVLYNPPSAWGRYPLSISPNQELPQSFTANDAKFKKSSTASVVYEIVQKCVVATIIVGRGMQFIGEITGLPTAESPRVGSFPCSTFRCTSWEALYAAENKCILKDVDGTYNLCFVVGGAVIGFVEAPADVVAAGLIRGTCIWTFNADNDDVDKVARDIKCIATNIFSDDN